MPRKKLDLANEVSLALNKEQEIEIVENADFEMLTMQQYQAEKQILAEKRKAIVLRLDGKKLEQVNKIIAAMDVALDKMVDPETSGMDFQFYAKSYDTLNKTLNTTIRLDTVDGSGKAARIALAVEFGNGTKLQTMIESG